MEACTSETKKDPFDELLKETQEVVKSDSVEDSSQLQEDLTKIFDSCQPNNVTESVELGNDCISENVSEGDDIQVLESTYANNDDDLLNEEQLLGHDVENPSDMYDEDDASKEIEDLLLGNSQDVELTGVKDNDNIDDAMSNEIIPQTPPKKIKIIFNQDKNKEENKDQLNNKEKSDNLDVNNESNINSTKMLGNKPVTNELLDTSNKEDEHSNLSLCPGITNKNEPNYSNTTNQNEPNYFDEIYNDCLETELDEVNTASVEDKTEMDVITDSNKMIKVTGKESTVENNKLNEDVCVNLAEISEETKDKFNISGMDAVQQNESVIRDTVDDMECDTLKCIEDKNKSIIESVAELSSDAQKMTQDYISEIVKDDTLQASNEEGSENVDSDKVLNVNLESSKDINLSKNADAVDEISSTKNAEVAKEISLVENDISQEIALTENADISQEIALTENVDDSQEIALTENVDISQEIALIENVDDSQEIALTENVDDSQEIALTENVDISQEIALTENADISQEIALTENVDDPQEIALTENADLSEKSASNKTLIENAENSQKKEISNKNATENLDHVKEVSLNKDVDGTLQDLNNVYKPASVNEEKQLELNDSIENPTNDVVKSQENDLTKDNKIKSNSDNLQETKDKENVKSTVKNDVKQSNQNSKVKLDSKSVSEIKENESEKHEEYEGVEGDFEMNFKVVREEQLDGEETKDESDSTAKKSVKIKLVTCDDLEKSKHLLKEVPGSEIEGGAFTRIVIISCITNIAETWPKESKIKPYFLSKSSLKLADLYDTFHDHSFLKDSASILVIFVMGMNETIDCRPFKSPKCTQTHPPAFCPRAVFDTSEAYAGILVDSLKSLKSMFEKDTHLSLLFSNLPFLSINLSYRYLREFDTKCGICFAQPKTLIKRVLKDHKILHSLFDKLSTTEQLNMVCNKKIVFNSIVAMKNESWLFISPEKTPNKYPTDLNNKLVDCIFDQEVIDYKKTHVTVPKVLEDNAPVPNLEFKVIIIGNSWLEGILNKSKWKDQLPSNVMILSKENFTFEDTKQLILKHTTKTEQALVLTTVSSDYMVDQEKFNECKDHETLTFPVVIKKMLDSPLKYADEICKKIDRLIEDINQQRKTCKIVYMTCFPMFLTFYYKYLIEKHGVECNHTINGNIVSSSNFKIFRTTLSLCMKTINSYIMQLNGSIKMSTCDIFSLMMQLANLNKIIYPLYIEGICPPNFALQKLVEHISEYITKTQDNYKKGHFSFKYEKVNIEKNKTKIEDVKKSSKYNPTDYKGNHKTNFDLRQTLSIKNDPNERKGAQNKDQVWYPQNIYPQGLMGTRPQGIADSHQEHHHHNQAMPKREHQIDSNRSSTRRSRSRDRLDRRRRRSPSFSRRHRSRSRSSGWRKRRSNSRERDRKREGRYQRSRSRSAQRFSARSPSYKSYAGSSQAMREDALKDLKIIHERECEAYRKHPEAHPDYDRMRYLWTDVMTSQGLDPYHQSLQSHWYEFWNPKLEDLLRVAWKDKRNKCLEAIEARRRRKRLPSSSSSSSSSSDSSSSSRRRKKRKKKSKKNKSSPAKDTNLKCVEELEGRINAFMAKSNKDDPVASTSSMPQPKNNLNVALLDVTSILSQLADRFGALGLSLTSLHQKAEEMSRKDENAMELVDGDAKMLLKLVAEKMRRLLSSESQLTIVQRAIMQEAFERLTPFLQTLEEPKKQETNEKELFGLDIEATAIGTKGLSVTQTIDFIKTALAYKRIQNVSNEQLMKIYMNVKEVQAKPKILKTPTESRADKIRKEFMSLSMNEKISKFNSFHTLSFEEKSFLLSHLNELERTDSNLATSLRYMIGQKK